MMSKAPTSTKVKIEIELTNGKPSGLIVDGVTGAVVAKKPAGVTTNTYEIEVIGPGLPSHTCVRDPVTGQLICT